MNRRKRRSFQAVSTIKIFIRYRGTVKRKKKKIEYSEKVDILRYFLNLYKIQTGISVDDPAEFLSSEGEVFEFDPNASYKLRVRQYGEWKSRRISVSLIGDASGSKSKCFKVIYDDILVVKIPPTPIKTFKKYLECIETEKRIVEKLMPDIECIVPRVSTILKRIHPFSMDADLNPERFENKCVNRLKNFPNLQNFLKIGDSFAFFMNLSKYSFLSNVIEKLHDVREAYQKEILTQEDVLWDLFVFEEKYGTGHDRLFYAMDGIYSQYDKEINRLMFNFGNAAKIPSYKARQWFLCHLAEKKIEKKENAQFPPAFIENLGRSFRKIASANAEDIEHYRRTIKKHVLKKTFFQNRTMMGGIVSNILNMIGNLKEKGVAVRDLKPDNVFVVGDWENNPILLASPESYSIGLIDFETAVSFDLRYDNKIAQPLLAGTPSYATPSHLFENTVLESIHSDLSRILFLQDWQAAISMIYNVSTGRRLAEKTGKVLPEIMKVMHKSVANNHSMSDVYIKSSRMFWNRATTEFEEKLKESEYILKSVETAIPENMKESLKIEILGEQDKIRKRIVRQMKSQNIFRSRKAVKNLVESPPEIISRYKMKWIKGIDVPKAPPKVRDRIIGLLLNLEQLKRHLKSHERVLNKLGNENPRLRVYDLLKIMFFIVHKSMYKHEWDKMAEETGMNGDMEDDDVTSEAAVAYEQTIAYVPASNAPE